MVEYRNALDHLVIAAHTLDQGAAFVRERLGVTPGGGGRHAAMGTHNHVLKLGRRQYLEVIAIDPQARPPAMPRWFDLDNPALQSRLMRRPRLIAWVVRTDDIDAVADEIYEQPAAVRPMQRSDFSWRFAFTADGSLPGDGCSPHLIQWDGPHPAETMPASGCELLTMSIAAKPADGVQRVVSMLELSQAVDVRPVSVNDSPRLFAGIRTPTGRVMLT